MVILSTIRGQSRRGRRNVVKNMGPNTVKLCGKPGFTLVLLAVFGIVMDPS